MGLTSSANGFSFVCLDYDEISLKSADFDENHTSPVNFDENYTSHFEIQGDLWISPEILGFLRFYNQNYIRFT